MVVIIKLNLNLKNGVKILEKIRKWYKFKKMQKNYYIKVNLKNLLINKKILY